MNILKIQKILSFIASLKPILFALIGGIVSGVVTRCSNEPITLKIENSAYEQQLQEIRTRQDSINTVLPTINESLLYLSERYK
tara:strand:+ start:982 stop:1230 length:249 start_codon:yes stop_codon:yes gene_type:complete